MQISRPGHRAKKKLACCREAHLCWVRMCISWAGISNCESKAVILQVPQRHPFTCLIDLFTTNQGMTASKSPNHSAPQSPPPQNEILLPSGSIILSESVPYRVGRSLNISQAILAPGAFPSTPGGKVPPMENHLDSW